MLDVDEAGADEQAERVQVQLVDLTASPRSPALERRAFPGVSPWVKEKN